MSIYYDRHTWQDNPSGGTPTDADNLNDWEGRIEAGITAAEVAAAAHADAVAAGGLELGYAQITADATRASTTPADVAGLSTTVTVGARPIMVIFDCNSVLNTAATGGVGVDILEDGVTIARLSEILATASNVTPGHREIRRTPTAGSHVYKIQLSALLSGTATIKAGPAGTTGPAFIQVLAI